MTILVTSSYTEPVDNETIVSDNETQIPDITPDIV